MKPFHLQIQRVPESRKLSFQGFGPSAIHPEGSQALPLSVDAIDAEADGSAVEEAWAGAAPPLARHVALPRDAEADGSAVEDTWAAAEPPGGALRGGATQRVP